MIDYDYDENGQVAAVTAGGQTQELTDADKRRVPGETLPETRTAQTAVKSTVEDLKRSYSSMTDAHGSGSIVVDIEATHGGYFNENRYYYLTRGMRRMVTTWTKNGGRPYLVNHDWDQDPRGRVVDARFVPTRQEMGFQALDVRVGHDEEIDMIIDGRALHTSVGSEPTDTVECSLCGHDLYHDGNNPQRYELEGEPDEDRLQEDAPGVFGELGMTNEDFYQVEQSDDGTWRGVCRHVRDVHAPMGRGRTHHIGWYLHAQNYKEVSRVSQPADVNEETGEFAHIRRIKRQTDDLDPEAAVQVMVDQLSSVEDPVVDRARYQVAREEDLYRAPSPQEAADIVETQGFGVMFDSGLWTSIHQAHSEKSLADQAKQYHEDGGRFVSLPEPGVGEKSFQEVLDADARDFGAWIRAQDFDRDTEMMLNRIYLNQ